MKMSTRIVSQKNDKRLSRWDNLSKIWQIDFAFRSPYERRQALIELDVISCMALRLTKKDLLTFYQSQFPVLRKFEDGTYYDQNGQIVFTVNPGLPGVGLARKYFEQIKDLKVDDNIPEWATDNYKRPFVPPFDRCDREKDYEEVWKEFERRFK
ncbi:MAG: hypothetical protein HQK65_18380 [Desulfamplus sp.]|nr:hypothetical protein [Desulfamplus sp.]